MAKVLACASAVGLAVIVVSIGADAVSEPYPLRSPEWAGVMCIHHDGSIYDPHCVTPQGRAETCDCGRDFHVAEPYCRPGERPAPSTADANRARYAAARKGSLKYMQYQGRRFCVPAPHVFEPDPMNNGVVGDARPPCCGA